MDVTLNDKENTIDGFARITYINNSPDTLNYIWFHLWPNAYKNDRTAFSDQMLENGNTAFYFSDKEQRGYINRLDFKVNGITARTEDHPQHIDITKLVLPTPLAPGQEVLITTPFHVKLPYNFSRGGFDKKTYQVTQWYPKPAVYDRKGWHPMPYLDQGEFYSEFGDYDVRITIPKHYVVAATGELQTEEEKVWLKNRENYLPPAKDKIVKPSPAKTAEKKTSGSKSNTSITARQRTAARKPVEATQPVATRISNDDNLVKTIRFTQNNIHDFAWFADKDFIVQQDTCQLTSGKIITISAFYTHQYQEHWMNAVQFSKDAVRFYSNEIGEYPYNTISAVQGPESFGGGMEYPTITVISPTETAKELDIVLAHEIGHNWFYGILASNERDHPWMDEGLNTFYEKKYTASKYGTQPQLEELIFQSLVKEKRDQPIATPSHEFSNLNYGVVAYHKTAKWLEHIEELVGEDAFRQAMQDYYKKWQFKHPQPEDFKTIIAAHLGDKASENFNLIYDDGLLPNQQLTGLKFITPFRPKSFSEYAKNPTKNVLIVSPAVGYNVYDGVMLGAFVTNYALPPSSFQYFAAPLYGTKSKKLNGIGKVSYSIFPERTFRKIELFANGSAFSMNEFTDSRNERHTFGFRKFVPGAEVTFREKSSRSTRQQFIQWKSYFISEDRLRISFDSIFNGSDTTILEVVNKNKQDFRIHQLKLGVEDSRALYPYSAHITAQGTDLFLRFAFEGKYFFNYKEGGLHVRLFAGKMFYKESNRYNVSRFALNMSGPSGEEDYTYSDYFIGRNRFEGLASQQIMMRDGGFKVRTELLANKVGKTGNWLTAINLNTSIPSRFNPLSILPIKIPIRLFADIGTYAEAWEKDTDSDRFLFDAGIHFPLFNETINFYFPLVYSNVYSDYAKTMYPKNRLFKTMTFSIDIDGVYKSLRKGIM